MDRIRARSMLGLLAALLAGLSVLAQSNTVDERLKRVAEDVFSRTDRVDADIAELKAILAIEPRSAQAHMLLGIAYRTKASSDLMGEAAGELRQALEIDPSLIPARLYLAHLYLDLARPERAREELQSALAQMPA